MGVDMVLIDSKFQVQDSFFLNQPFMYQLVDMNLAIQKFSLAADYSVLVPDYSFYDYHPLQELKPGKRVQETSSC